MSDNPEYIVTRGGREVLRGDATEVLNAARQGRLLSNDLVYQSSSSQWSFARSLSILRGFPLRDRAPLEAEAASDGSMLDTGRRLLTQRRRLRRIFRGVAVVIGLIVFTAILFLIPDAKRTKKTDDLKKILELDDRAMKIEGSGQGFSDNANKRKGSSNMDSKAVTVDGEYNAQLETDDEGRKASLLLTQEEKSELAKVVQPKGGGQAVSSGAPLEQPKEADRSPSINAPDLPPEQAEHLDDGSEQPPVLIRPKLEDLKRELETISAMTAPDGDTTASEQKFQRMEKVVQKMSRLEAQVRQASVTDETTAELDGMIKSIRQKLTENCETIEQSEHCKLRVQHPEWSAATLSAVVRKDVILGMDKSQVKTSIGEPTEEREIGTQTVWCYDADCERRVEFTEGRAMVYTAAVVTSDTSIENAPPSPIAD